MDISRRFDFYRATTYTMGNWLGVMGRLAPLFAVALIAAVLVSSAYPVLASNAEVPASPEWPDYQCIKCHAEVTPGIVRQYLRGAMGKAGVQNPDVANALGGMDRVPCTVCHGSEHTSSDDWRKAKLPSYTTCQACHPKQVQEFLSGKHSYAWRAMMAIPMVKEMPKEELLNGCGSCHKIGVKEPEELLKLGLDRPYGIGATCDQCHTRHTFSTYEARKPETCAKCHMGFDHPQWEMWSKSKHGLIYFTHKDRFPLNRSLKYVKPSDYPAPTCQLCHMPKGNHSVITPWGFLALVAFKGRPSGLEIVDDPEWEAAKVEILKALRVLTPDGKPTPVLDAVLNLKIVRATPEEFMDARKRLVEVCTGCHSRGYVLAYIKAADEVVRESTIQLAKAVKLTKEAREKGILPPRPGEPDNPYPFLLNFYEEPSGPDREVWLIFMEYRMRAFQGMFHVNPDYTHWYGWSQIRKAVRDVEENIREAAKIKQLEANVTEVMKLGESLKELESKLKELKPTTVTVTETVPKTVERVIEKDRTATYLAATALAAALAAIAVVVILQARRR